MRIAVFSTVPADTYSGGRYHALMICAVLARQGHETYFICNNRPIFFDEVCKLCPENPPRLIVTDDFVCHPTKRFDAVFIAPQSDPKRQVYVNALRFSRDSEALTVLINFESGNWFNAVSPNKRSISSWDEWQLVAEQGALILSSTKESQTFARDFYKNIPPTSSFDVWEPAINSAALLAATDTPRERHIALFARPTDAHKGSDDITSLIHSSLRGTKISILLGKTKGTEDFQRRVHQLGEAAGIEIHFVTRASDVEKFALLKNASVLVFLSRFEGYGYPPVEALACGTRVVAFDLPVIRETCGDLVDYVAPGDFPGLRAAVRNALDTPFPDVMVSDRIRHLTDPDLRAQQLESVIRNARREMVSRTGKRRLEFKSSVPHTVRLGRKDLTFIRVLHENAIASAVPADNDMAYSLVQPCGTANRRRVNNILLLSDADRAVGCQTLYGTFVGGGLFEITLAAQDEKPAPPIRLANEDLKLSRSRAGEVGVSVYGWLFPRITYDGLFLVDGNGFISPCDTALPAAGIPPHLRGEGQRTAFGFVTTLPRWAAEQEAKWYLVAVRGDRVVGVSGSLTFPAFESSAPLIELPPASSGAPASADLPAIRPSRSPGDEKTINPRGWVAAGDELISLSVRRGDRVIAYAPLNRYRLDVAKNEKLDPSFHHGFDYLLPAAGGEVTVSLVKGRVRGEERKVPVEQGERPKLLSSHAKKLTSSAIWHRAATLGTVPKPPSITQTQLDYHLDKKRLYAKFLIKTSDQFEIELTAGENRRSVSVQTIGMLRHDGRTETLDLALSETVDSSEVADLSIRVMYGGREVLVRRLPPPIFLPTKAFRVHDIRYEPQWNLLWIRGHFAIPAHDLKEVEVRRHRAKIAAAATGIKYSFDGNPLAGWRVEALLEDPLEPGETITLVARTVTNLVIELEQTVPEPAEAPSSSMLETLSYFGPAVYREKMLCMEKKFRAERLVLFVVHNLDAVDRPEKKIALTELNDALAAEGCRLVIVHHCRNRAELDVPEINLFDPDIHRIVDDKTLMYADDFHESIDFSSGAGDPFSVRMTQLAFGFANMCNRDGPSWERIEEVTLAEGETMDMIIGHTKPDMVLVWHQWNPLMEFTQEICWRRSIPTGILHEGMLPGTLSLDADGMMAESSATGVVSPVQEPIGNLADRIISSVRKNRLDRKVSSGLSIAEEVASKVHAAGAHLIFYAGSNDWHSGILPYSERTRIHSPFYTDTVEGLDALLEHAEALNYFVLFKPHPNLHPSNFDRQHPRLITTRESDVTSCLLASDLLVTLVSAVAYIALCHERPVALLGRNPLSGTGATYDLTARADLPSLIAEALKGSDFETRLGRFRQHVAALLEHHLYPYGHDTGATHLRYRDLAKAIIKLAE